MALATYSDLQSAVASWLNRTDLTSVIPDFVTLAEGRIARDLRLRRQVATTTLTCVAGNQSVTLPSDWLETENITLSSTTPPRQLHVVTPEYLDERFPNAYFTGQPDCFCVLGNNIQLGPTPDQAYTISLDYYQRWTALATTPANWLLTNHPSIYLYASLAEASIYLMDDPRAAFWETKYKADCEALQSADDESLRAGSTMRVRVVP